MEKKKRTVEWVFKVAEYIVRRRNLKLEQGRARRSKLPFAKVTEMDFLGVPHLMLEVLKHGSLADIIQFGSGVELPQPYWTSSITYIEDFRNGEGMLEERIRTAIARLEMDLHALAVSEILRTGLLAPSPSYSPHEVHYPLATVFVQEFPLSYSAYFEQKVLEPTLFTTYYGAGSRIFLRKPVQKAA